MLGFCKLLLQAEDRQRKLGALINVNHFQMKAFTFFSKWYFGPVSFIFLLEAVRTGSEGLCIGTKHPLEEDPFPFVSHCTFLHGERKRAGGADLLWVPYWVMSQIHLAQ